MADLPTFRDLFRVGRDEMLSRNSAITADAIDKEGTDANALVAAGAATGDEVVGQLARVVGDSFMGSAKGEKLDRLILDRYNLARKPAGAGFTSVNWTTTVANPAAFDIPAGTRVATADGASWFTLTGVNFPVGVTGPIVTAVRSTAAGLTQQVAIGTLTNILDKPAGSPSDLAVTNSLASSGADDAETDEDYANRARQYFVTARRGTLAAIQAAAVSFPGVRRASVYEVVDGQSRPARVVECVISDAFTDSLVGKVVPAAYNTQSQVFAGLLSAALEESRCGGIYVRIIVSTVVLMPVQLAFSFAAGADPDEAAFKGRSLIVGYINSLAPGQTFNRVNAGLLLQSVPGLVVTGNEIVSPLGNVIPRTLEVLRASLSTVIAVSAQPDRALQGSSNPDTR